LNKPEAGIKHENIFWVRLLKFKSKSHTGEIASLSNSTLKLNDSYLIC